MILLASLPGGCGAGRGKGEERGLERGNGGVG